LIGLLRYLATDSSRAYGIAFNPNHHAAMTLMGLPLWFTLLWQRATHDSRSRMELLRSPEVLLWLAGFAALLGAAASYSRGPLALGGLVLALWVGREAINQGATQGEAGAVRRRLVMRFVAIGAVVAALALTFGEGLLARGDRADVLSANSRTAFWKAELLALRESHFLGIGLGGSMQAINRHSDIALPRLPVHAHNDPLQWCVEYGLPLTLVLGLVLGRLLLLERRRRASLALDGPAGALRRAADAGVAIALLASLVDFHLRVPLIGFMVLAMISLSLAPGLSRLPRNSTRG
jgi:O-antigen ligase